MSRLSEKKHWDAVHVQQKRHWETKQQTENFDFRHASLPQRIKRRIRAVLGDNARVLSAYDEHLLWNVIYERFLPKADGSKALEVGSAPGNHLVQLNAKFGLSPYGVEYSEPGVELNRQVFSAHHLDPDNVIHADFFAPSFQGGQDYFDVVISRGFIEHFADVGDVIEKHVNLLTRAVCLSLRFQIYVASITSWA